jgi:hypothetical protein
VSTLVTRRDATSGSWFDRLGSACLAVVIVLGSALLWLGVPVGGAWVAAQASADPVGGVLLALLAIPLAMVGLGWALYRVSARYEAMRGGEPRHHSPPAWRTSLSEERAEVRRRKSGRPLIEVSMTVSAAAAVLVLTIWFFFFAELRLSPFP